MSGSTLTVALPTCNGERHLAEALRSVIAQAGVSFDLVVCDDCSDDGTLEIVRAEAGDRARVARNSERLGLAGNWNQCVALSHTPLVAVFHQDDVMRPGHLAAHHSALRSDERLGLVCSAADVIDDEGRPVHASVIDPGGLGPEDRRFKPGGVVAEMARGNPLRCSAVTIRKEAHADVGGFDPEYRYVVDWDFWLRVGRRWGVLWLAAPTVAIRWHPHSETQRFKTGTIDLDETERLLTELFSRDDIRGSESGRLRRQAHRRLARALLNRAHDAIQAGDPDLMQSCFRRAVALRPGIFMRLALDPKLAVQLTTMAVVPGLAGRWLSRRPPPSVS